MGYGIVEIDGVVIGSDSRFPVSIHSSPHAINGESHVGQLDESQIPINIMRADQHQLDPHTMIVDGRDVSSDGSKLDTIESGAEVNNLTDQQAQSLTSGSNCNWHNHGDIYYTKSQLQTSGSAQVTWNNITSVPETFTPSDHTHLNDSSIGGPYYTQSQLQTAGQSVVDWLNIANKPTLGGNNWLSPVKNKFVGSSLPSDGSGYSNGDRTIWFDGPGADQHIFQWNGSFWTDVRTPLLNDTVLVSDDGDEKPAQYWYNGANWIKISDPDYANHGSLSGLLNDDHTQYLNVSRHGQINGNPHSTTISQTISSDSFATFTINNLNALSNGSDASALHSHNSTYYTKSQIDSTLSLYYTKTQLDNGSLDGRYYTKTLLDNGQLDTRYFTESEIILNYYSKTQLDSGQLDSRYYTKIELGSSSGAGNIGLNSISGLDSTSVQTALESLNTNISSITVSLDSAYNNGSVIYVDSGAVKFDAGSATNSPIELTNKLSAPTTNLSAGQICVVDNVLYIYDGSRSKWLSPSKTLTFGKTGNVNGYMLRETGEISDENGGYRMMRSGTIVGLSISSTWASSNKEFYLRINRTTILLTFSTDASGDYINNNLNLDFSSGDVLSIKAKSDAVSIQNTCAVVEFCHRI